MVRRKDPEITAYTLKNGKKYYQLKTYLGTDPESGKKIKVTRSRISTRKEANQLRSQLKSSFENHINPKPKNMRVKEVYKIWIKVLSQDVRGSTINRIQDTWKNHTEPNFGNLYIDKLKPEHIQEYANDLAAKYITYRSILNQLHRIIKYAIFRKWTSHDPFKFIIIPKKSAIDSRDNSKNFYEKDELIQFLEVAKKYNKMKYTCFLAIASLGCRRGEALALKWSDIDFKEKTVRIERTVAKNKDGFKTIDNVKNGIHHTVPMSDNLYNVLKDYKKHCQKINDNCEWLFHQSDGTYFWSQQIDIWIKYLYKFDEKQCEKWNKKHPDNKKKPLRKITPHGLRHTLATLLYEGNQNIRPTDVQYILGHSTPKTALEIYTHVTQSQKKTVRNSINNLNL